MRSASTVGLAACVVALPLSLYAADWPQWRGPDRDGISKETGLLKTWPKGGPELVWTFDKAGTGYAGPAVVGGKLYTMGARDKTEYVFALDAKGQELWSVKIADMYDFENNAWSGGPNATPTVDGGLVFALGSQGELVCVTTDGKERWRKDLRKDLGGQVNAIGGGDDNMGWGFSWSPLVDGDNLICTPGGPQGLLAALNKKTGEVVWRSKDVKEQATYTSPILATIGGVKQVIQMTQEGVVGVAPKTGDVLWYFKRENPFPDVVCSAPVCRGDLVYISGWGGGCDLIKVEPDGKKFKATGVYHEAKIANRIGGLVLVGDYLYGYHEDQRWACQEFRTGAIKWESGRNALSPGLGTLTAADGRLYCLSERNKKGLVGLLEPTPGGG
jgi:outer membrane protein assembly factor BamB